MFGWLRRSRVAQETPPAPQGRQVQDAAASAIIIPDQGPGLRVDSYGPGRFRIGGQTWNGPVIILPDRVIPWLPEKPDDPFSENALAPLLDVSPPPEVVIIGCGAVMRPLPGPLAQVFRSRGIALDSMATAAACRSYNILLAEDRFAAAALLPLPLATQNG